MFKIPHILNLDCVKSGLSWNILTKGVLIHIFHHKTAFDLCDYTSKPVQYCNSILLLTIIGFHIFLLDRLQCVTNFITCFKIQSILNLPKVKLNGLKETIEFLVVMRDCRKLNIICCSCTRKLLEPPFQMDG